MRDGLERGETITRTAAATGMFPPLVLQMISVGEESGSVDTLLTEVAEYYEREVDYDLKNLSSSIEPILLVAVGGLVLVLALGVFLPMWDMTQAFRAK
jgi:MSHA biogenesis protein MshG